MHFSPPPIWLVGMAAQNVDPWPPSAAPPLCDSTSETHHLTHNLRPTLKSVRDVATLADPLLFLSSTSLHFNCHLLFFFAIPLADSAFDGCVACKPCCFNSPPRCKNNKRKKKLIFFFIPSLCGILSPLCLLPLPLPCWALLYRDCQASWDIECHCGCLIVTAGAGCRGVNTTAVFCFFLHVPFLNNVFHWFWCWTENVCFVDIFLWGWTPKSSNWTHRYCELISNK